MSLDERLRTGLRGWGESLDADAPTAAVVKRGRRKARMRAATATLILAAVAGGSFAVAERWSSPRTVDPATQTDGPVATREPADEEFRRSYGVGERWAVASGVVAGERWEAWAYESTDGSHCLVGVAGSCDPGSLSKEPIRETIGGTDPPGIVGVQGFAMPHVRFVRVHLTTGPPVEAATVRVPGWDVRVYIVVVPKERGDILKVLPLDEFRAPTGGLPFPPPGAAVLEGFVTDAENSPVPDAIVSIPDLGFEARTGPDGRFEREIVLPVQCVIVDVGTAAAGRNVIQQHVLFRIRQELWIQLGEPTDGVPPWAKAEGCAGFSGVD